MSGRDELEAVIRRELSTTVAAAYGSPAWLTSRYNQATTKILAAADAYALEVADTPPLTAQRRQALDLELTLRGKTDRKAAQSSTSSPTPPAPGAATATTGPASSSTR